MQDYCLLILADLLLAVSFAIKKIYQKRIGTAVCAGFAFVALQGLFGAFIFFLYNGGRFALTAFSVFIAAISSLLCTSYSLLGFQIMKRCGISLYTLFLMSGGMTIPFIYGVMFLNESINIFRIIGLCVIIVGVFFTCMGKGKSDVRSIILCVAVFFLNGGVSIVSKLHSINTELAVNPSEFVVLSNIVSFFVNSALLCFFSIKDKNKKETEPQKLQAAIFILPALAALVGGISSVLQLTGAQHIDASLLYPFITGGSIVLSTVTGALFFREKLTRNTVIGVCFAFIGTLMFL